MSTSKSYPGTWTRWVFLTDVDKCYLAIITVIHAADIAAADDEDEDDDFNSERCTMITFLPGRFCSNIGYKCLPS